jgi:hypothetical protein
VIVNSSKFNPSSKTSPCPVCENITGHCKSKPGSAGDTLIYCHNNQVNPGQPISGYKWLKAASLGGWQGGIFAPVDSSTPKRSLPPKSAKPQPKVDYASAAERDRQYRSYLSKLTLHPDDRADLVRRGVADATIAQIKSKEGKEPGYLCPCYDPDGRIVGAQWRLRNPSGARYKWINWICGGAEYKGELPLTVHRPLGEAKPGVAIVEGIGAKSILLAQRSGMVAIGAGSSSQFAGCSETHWIDFLGALGSKTLYFYPDSGCLKNPQVLDAYRKFFEFTAANGYQLKIAWWGQTEKGVDIDELEDWGLIKFISVEEFEAMAGPATLQQDPAWDCMAVHNYQLGTWKNKDVTGDKEQQHWATLAEVNPNIEFVSERVGQANGSSPAHLIQVYRVFTPECDFDLRVKRVIVPNQGEGRTEWEVVQLQGGRVKKYSAVVPETATTKADKFIDSLKSGSGASIVSRANYRQLSALIQNRRSSYRNAGGKTYRLAPVVGQQEDGYWVFENRQFTPQGRPCSEEESGWLFDLSLVVTENLHSPKIKPEDPLALYRLAIAELDCFHPVVLPFVWAEHGNVLAGFHRQFLKKNGFKSFAVSLSTGERGGGKTSALKAAASVVDNHYDKTIVGAGVTASALDLRLSLLSGLPLIVDDPFPLSGGNQAEIKTVEKIINNAIQRSYDQSPRPVRGGSNLPPVATLCLTMNRGLGSKSDALQTRILAKEYATGQPDWTRGQELTEAMDAASAGFGSLLRVQIDIEKIKEYRFKFLQIMPLAQARQAEALAIQCYFTEQYCKIAGVKFDSFEWHQRVLCKQANATEAGKDSLMDFLSKLGIMIADGVLNESSITSVVQRKTGKKYLALHLASIWEKFEKRWSPNYSRNTIESLIEAQEGLVERQNQKFVATHSAWQDYERALNAYKRGEGYRDKDGDLQLPIRPLKTAGRKCVLVPQNLVDAAIGSPAAAESFSSYESDHAASDQGSTANQIPDPASEASKQISRQPILKAKAAEPELQSAAENQQYGRDGQTRTIAAATDGREVEVRADWLDFGRDHCFDKYENLTITLQPDRNS